MPNLSADVRDAAIRALRGESDVRAVHPAFDDQITASIIALAPDAHPIIRTVAARRSGLIALMDTSTITDPALHDAVAQMIGNPKDKRRLIRGRRSHP